MGQNIYIMEKEQTASINEPKKISLSFDPSRDDVLGVFGTKVHIKSYGFEDTEEDDFDTFNCVLIVPIREYIRVWKNWLQGKKKYCESYNSYCGVMGYTSPIDYQEVDKIILNDWDEKKGEYIEVPTRTFIINKFEDHHDFEHG